ncbi:hypothetical protein GCM10009661_66930 [Catellatospora chokoriensis]|uniref:Uncharacterized protein n=1 Tax=Catellatospora chokoriensis TaxID=310353 RepID=A0A8J3NPF6_9ACTN|nr:hypothetical protein Cch02nite_08600 [Catellatospora chokoriensis]
MTSGYQENRAKQSRPAARKAYAWRLSPILRRNRAARAEPGPPGASARPVPRVTAAELCGAITVIVVLPSLLR